MEIKKAKEKKKKMDMALMIALENFWKHEMHIQKLEGSEMNLP